MSLPQAPDQRWSLDFASDTLTDGRRFRILVVVDDFTRECLCLIPDTSLSGKRVARELDAIIARRAARPLLCVSDNGTELTSSAILTWCQDRKVGWLNETLFTSLRQTRAVLAAWQRDYNEVRPHSAHDGEPPASIRLPPGSPASRPLRAGFADGLRPVLTKALRGGANKDGRDGETPLDRTEKHRHDGPGGNPGLYF